MHTTSNKTLAWTCLIAGLLISAISAYFSILGLSKIFVGAFAATVIMGTVIEIGKLAGVSWLFKYWREAPKILVAFLMAAVLFVMVLTSTGVFGFLSKAYSDAYAPIQSQQIQIDLVDKQLAQEQLKSAAANKILNQLDKSVDTLINDNRADRSLVQRNRQAKERKEQQAIIQESNKQVASLQTQRAGLTVDTQKMEQDVGPIAFIAKSIYGDSSKNTVDKAVSFVIALLVFVLDPLAILLLLAANFAFIGERLNDVPQFNHNIIQRDMDTITSEFVPDATTDYDEGFVEDNNDLPMAGNVKKGGDLL